MLSYVSFCSRLTSRFSSVWPSSSERTTFGVIVARKIFDAVIHCPGIVQLVSLNAASSIPRNFNLPRPEQRRPPRGYFNRVNRIAVRFDGARSTIEICSVGLSIPSNVHRHARLYRKNTRLNFTFAFFFRIFYFYNACFRLSASFSSHRMRDKGFVLLANKQINLSRKRSKVTRSRIQQRRFANPIRTKSFLRFHVVTSRDPRAQQSELQAALLDRKCRRVPRIEH